MPGAPSGRHDGFAEAFELDGEFLIGGKQLGCGGVNERAVVQEGADGARGGCDGGVDKRIKGTGARQVMGDGADAAESFDDVGDVRGGAADQHGVEARESREVEPSVNDGARIVSGVNDGCFVGVHELVETERCTHLRLLPTDGR